MCQTPGPCRLCRGQGHPGAGPGGRELRSRGARELLSSRSESLLPQLDGGATAWIKTSDGVCGAPFQGHGEGLPFGSRLVTEFLGPLSKVIKKASLLPGWLLCCFDFCEVGSYVALHSLKPAVQLKLTLNS